MDNISLAHTLVYGSNSFRVPAKTYIWDHFFAAQARAVQYNSVFVCERLIVFECCLKAATVISKRVSAGIVGEDSLEGLLTLGAYLVRHHREHCKHGVLVDSPDDIDRLELWFQQTTLEKGVLCFLCRTHKILTCRRTCVGVSVLGLHGLDMPQDR